MTQRTPESDPGDEPPRLPPLPGDVDDRPVTPQQYRLDPPAAPVPPPGAAMPPVRPPPGPPMIPMGPPPPRPNSGRGLMLGGLIAAGVVIVLVVVLFGLNGGDETPTDVVDGAMHALARQDLDGFISAFCADSQAEMESERDEAEAQLATIAGLLSDDGWEVTDERIEGDTARVTIRGPEEMFDDGGEEVHLVREDGDWKMCEESVEMA